MQSVSINRNSFYILYMMNYLHSNWHRQWSHNGHIFDSTCTNNMKNGTL